MPAHRFRSLVRTALTPPALGSDERADRELIACFLASRDEDAFAALVRRHGPMVRAVCLAVLRNPTDADDAFQATFLVLVRRASVIRDSAAVGGWLYAVAGRVARRLRATIRHLHSLPEDVSDPRDGVMVHTFDLRSILDEEVARLPEVYRLVVQACYVTGRTTTEAATLLGWAKGTVLTRLAWARQRLRSRLAARGVGLAVGGFGSVLGRPAVCAVGRALLSNTTRAAVAAAAGETVLGLVSERTVTLSEGVIRVMVQNKLKWAAGMVLVAVLTGVGIGKWAAAGEPGSQPPRTSKAPAPATPPDPVRPSEPARATTPPAPIDPPYRDQAPDRRVSSPPAPRPEPTPVAPPSLEDLTPGPLTGTGKQFVVSRPVGIWSREVVIPDGNTETTMRVTVKFEEDRLTIRLATMIERQEVETVLDADYSITKDSVVFGVVTGSDLRVPAGGKLPTGVALTEGEFVDQPFTFRFRVDRGALTVKDLRMPGVNQQGDAGLGQLLGGRYAVGAEEPPAAANPQPPTKGRGPSVAPRRVSPPTLNPSQIDGPFIPPPTIPGLVPGGVRIGPSNSSSSY